MQLLALDKTNKEVAWSLGLLKRIVETHRRNTRYRMGVQTREALIRPAVRAGVGPGSRITDHPPEPGGVSQFPLLRR